MPKRLASLVLVTLLGVICLGSSCNPNPPPTRVTVHIVNDQPGAVATIEFRSAQFNVIYATDRQVTIDASGRAQHTEDLGNTFNVNATTTCGGFAGCCRRFQTDLLHPRNAPSATVDCMVSVPPPASLSCESFNRSLLAIDLFENPVPPPDPGCSQYPSDFSVQTTREAFARDFLSTHQAHQRASNLLYSWLLNSNPPDGTVVQNLDAGVSAESQMVLVVSGPQFFAQSNNDNAIFVSRAYRALLQRDPAQWERDAAVEELNGYWRWVSQPCPPECFEGCEPPPGDCGWWEWYQKGRDELAWGIVSSHEFHQVGAQMILYGVQLRREATSTEIESLAYHMDATGRVLEGLVVVTRSQEFYDKSIP